MLALLLTGACSRPEPRVTSPQPPASLVAQWSQQRAPGSFEPVPLCMDDATLQRTPHDVVQPEPRSPSADGLFVHLTGLGVGRPGEYALRVQDASSHWAVIADLAEQGPLTCARARTAERAGVRIEVVSDAGSETYCGHWSEPVQERGPTLWYANILVRPSTQRLRFSVNEVLVHELQRPAQDPEVELVWLRAAAWLGVRIVDPQRVGTEGGLGRWAEVAADRSSACWRLHRGHPNSGSEWSGRPRVWISDAFFALEFRIPGEPDPTP
jgi:hypothetical protein